MPIVHVRARPRGDAPVTAALAAIAEGVAKAAGCSTREVWCTFTPVTGMTIGTDAVDDASEIAYVDLLMRQRTGGVLSAAARATSDHLGIPIEDVWARFVKLERGDVYAGGQEL